MLAISALERIAENRMTGYTARTTAIKTLNKIRDIERGAERKPIYLSGTRITFVCAVTDDNNKVKTYSRVVKLDKDYSRKELRSLKNQLEVNVQHSPMWELQDE